MTATSAVTESNVKALELAALRLEREAGEMMHRADGHRALAARAGSIFSDPRATAACYLIDGLRKAAAGLTRSALEHRQRITALRNSPCPACMAGQSRHCELCGSCKNARRGLSCAQLECESAVTKVSV